MSQLATFPNRAGKVASRTTYRAAAVHRAAAPQRIDYRI